MKKHIILLWIVVIALAGWFLWPKVGGQSFGVVDTSKTILAGSSTSFASLASTTSNTATVTSPYMAGGYATTSITQHVDTYGAESIRLNIAAEGGTATSTVSFRVYGSNDGTNWWDYGVYDDYYASSTSALGAIATSTLASKLSIFGFDPGTTTSTRSFYFPTLGWKQLRFIFLGEDVTADPDDGVGMWAEVNRISTF